MAAEIVINKVVVTDEARFDYECLFGQPIPKADIKRETEEYIDGRQGRINGFYFRTGISRRMPGRRMDTRT